VSVTFVPIASRLPRGSAARPYSPGVPELGLFPLPLVLVPTERIPLHIFEPRYQELVQECLDSDGEFGLVLATGDGAVHEIGTRARVASILEELDDGRMNIVVEGGERFRLLELTRGRSFQTGVVEEVHDDEEPPASNDLERALSVFRELAALAESDVDIPDESSPNLDWQLAARVDFGVDPKQELLASTSPRERMRRLAELLEASLEAVRLERTLRERAGSNGKVVPLDGDPPGL
jgi:ATP-dependent Lon protease